MKDGLTACGWNARGKKNQWKIGKLLFERS